MMNWSDTSRRRSLGRRATCAVLMGAALAPTHPATAPSGNAEQDNGNYVVVAGKRLPISREMKNRFTGQVIRNGSA
jgi:hypothetical protein